MSLYLEAPKGVISLKNFERFAVKRLHFLIKILETNGKKEDFVPLLSELCLVSESDVLIEGSQKDIITHFTLRLMLTAETDTRDFLLKSEKLLFKLRLQCLSDTELHKFLKYTCSRLDKLCQNSSQFSRSDASLYAHLCNIFQQIKKPLQSWRKVAEISRVVPSIKKFTVDFTVVPDLVAGRLVCLDKGQAMVPYCYLQDVLLHCFELNLRNGMQKCEVLQKNFDKRCKHLCAKLQVILRNKYKPHSDLLVHTSCLSHGDIEIESHLFPPCMAVLHKTLQKFHRLQHHARIQYTLFLKEIGMPVHEALHFWKTEYSKECPITGQNHCIHKWKGNEGRYKYNIRHLYGLEGSCINYRGHCCNSLQDFSPSCRSSGGCPFKHFDHDSLAAYLAEENINGSTADIIFNQCTEMNYSLACQTFLNAKKNMVTKHNISCINSRYKSPLPVKRGTEELNDTDLGECTNERVSKRTRIAIEQNQNSSEFETKNKKKEVKVKLQNGFVPYSKCLGESMTTEFSNPLFVSKDRQNGNQRNTFLNQAENSAIKFKTEEYSNLCNEHPAHDQNDNIENRNSIFSSNTDHFRKFRDRSVHNNNFCKDSVKETKDGIVNSLDETDCGVQSDEDLFSDDSEDCCVKRNSIADGCCYQHGLCLSQFGNHDKQSYVQPIMKPSEFYFSYKVLCDGLKS